jgi:hypothetical protein
MATITTEVEVDVDLDDFSTQDIIRELEIRASRKTEDTRQIRAALAEHLLLEEVTWRFRRGEWDDAFEYLSRATGEDLRSVPNKMMERH